MDFKNKKILVTGGAGFLGSHVVDRLKNLGVSDENITVPRSKDCDLRIKENVMSIVKDKDIVIHLAAVCGGIGANMKSPGSFYYDNALIGIQMIHESYKANVEKFVAVGTICAYPKNTPVPFKEEDLWNGYPEETNAPYGLAKKMMLVQSQAYRQQYGFNCIYLLPVNLFGPCFSEDTDVYTPKGIVNIKMIKKGDLIYSLNPNTHNLEIERVIATQINKTNEWYNFNGRGVDFKVTPDHNIYFKTGTGFNKRRADYFKNRAGKQYGQITLAHHNKLQNEFVMDNIDLSKYIDNEHILSKDGKYVRDFKHSHSKETPIKFNSIDFSEFLGWYISEGSISMTQNSKGGKQSIANIPMGQIRISQSKVFNNENYNKIKELLTRMHINFGCDEGSFFFSSRLFRNFIESEIGINSENKSIPSFVFDNLFTSTEFRETLFKTLMLGDGNKNMRRYTTKSEKLKDEFIQLAFLIGKKHSIIRNDGCWRIYFRPIRPNTTVKYKDISINKCDNEPSYCVTTEKNHIIYAGRNGKFNWIGQCDNFNLASSHVIPALIRKCISANRNNDKEIICWGDGSPTREFLYVDDAAKGILMAMKDYNKPDPVNIGAGFEISMKELVELIADLTGFEGNIIWDKTKPNGQLRRCLDTSRAEKEFGFKAETSFREGLKRTIDWYKSMTEFEN